MFKQPMFMKWTISQNVHDLLEMLIPQLTEAETNEIPVSHDYSLTGIERESTRESC
jgi:hypothetical protein